MVTLLLIRLSECEAFRPYNYGASASKGGKAGGLSKGAALERRAGRKRPNFPVIIAPAWSERVTGAGKRLRRDANWAKPLQLTVGLAASIRETRTVAKILVVDDDPVMQMTIQRLLQQAGHAVTVADDGQKAIARFQGESFDLVVMDIFMPGMDGLEAMRLILKHAPSTPILMTSGRPNTPNSISEPDYLTMATKLGAVSALPKPFKPAALLAMVSACLERGGTNAAPSRPGPDAVPNA